MSAFIVSRQHIHQLVTALDTYVRPTEEPTALGQTLWDENITSVSYRYNNEPVSDLPGPIGETYVYEYVTPRRQLTPVEVHTIARCYRYQSCEHDAWETSASCQLITLLMTAIESKLSKTEGQIRDSKEAQDADWEIWDDTPRVPPPPVEKKPVRHINLVETAKLVRKALKAAYPTVKFAVHSKSYSGGSRIDVSWTDGPTQKQVEPLLNSFCGAQFDGMIDLKSHITQEYEGEVVSFGADYVMGQRSISTAFLRQIACKVAAQYKVAVPNVINGGEKYDTDHGQVVSTGIVLENAPPFGHKERLEDVIYHEAHRTSALPKPRIRVMPTVREVPIATTTPGPLA